MLPHTPALSPGCCCSAPSQAVPSRGQEVGSRSSSPGASRNTSPGRERGCPGPRTPYPAAGLRPLLSLTRLCTAAQQPSLSGCQAPDPGLGRARGKSLRSGLRPGCQQSSAQHLWSRTSAQGSSSFSRQLLTPYSISCLPSQPSPAPPGPREKERVLPDSPHFQPQVSEQADCSQGLPTQLLSTPRATLCRQGKGEMVSQPLHPTTTAPGLPRSLPWCPHIALPPQAACRVPSAWSCEHRAKSQATQPSTGLHPEVPRRSNDWGGSPFHPHPSRDSAALCKRLEGTRCPPAQELNHPDQCLVTAFISVKCNHTLGIKYPSRPCRTSPPFPHSRDSPSTLKSQFNLQI